VVAELGVVAVAGVLAVVADLTLGRGGDTVPVLARDAVAGVLVVAAPGGHVAGAAVAARAQCLRTRICPYLFAPMGPSTKGRARSSQVACPFSVETTEGTKTLQNNAHPGGDPDRGYLR